MELIEEYNLSKINKMHWEIFGGEFPIDSYYRKTSKYLTKIYIIKENDIEIGFTILIVKNENSILYGWYGGILPVYQKGGKIYKLLYLIENIARDNSIKLVGFSTYNSRPHMLTAAIKYGYDIVKVSDCKNGESKRIEFRKKLKENKKCVLDINNINKKLYLFEKKTDILYEDENSITLPGLERLALHLVKEGYNNYLLIANKDEDSLFKLNYLKNQLTFFKLDINIIIKLR